MKIFIATLLTAALFQLVEPPAQINNSTTQDTKVQAVQAEAPRKEPTLPPEQEKALTEQQAVVEPEVVATPEPVKVPEPAPPVVETPQITQASGCEKYRDIIDNYSWNVDTAIAVCNAESSGNATTSNLSDYHSFADCRGSFGLFQINCSHGRVYDPGRNIQIAAAMYEARGWKPWAATTCKYKVKCY